MIETTTSFFPSEYGVYLIAEIGGNHEGNFEYAKKLTRLALESGVNAIKFQIYTGESLVNPLLSPDRCEHFKKFQLSNEEYIELAQMCEECQVSFMASVWDVQAFDYIDKYIPIYKIGSGDLTAFNLLKRIAITGKPIILSTGLSNITEIAESIAFINSIDRSYVDNRKIALLQCTTMYPIPDEDANLNVMTTLKEKFNLPVGFSNHTIGRYAPEIAVAMGAEIIEVHFTDTRENKIFRDHQVSFTCDEIKTLIEKIAIIKKLQGSYEKKPEKSEIDANHIEMFRRAVYPSRDIPSGKIIDEADLITLRPNKGIDSKHYYTLLGKRARVDINKLEPLQFDMFY